MDWKKNLSLSLSTACAAFLTKYVVLNDSLTGSLLLAVPVFLLLLVFNPLIQWIERKIISRRNRQSNGH